MELASVEDLAEKQVRGRNVLVRVSFDAFDKEGYIKDSLRIEASEKTIRILKEKGAKRIILLSYAGRPDGYDPALSMRPAADFLYGLFREEVYFMPAVGRLGTFIANPADYILYVKHRIEEVHDGGIVLLDNLRFWQGENEGDKPVGQEFAKLIASLGDIYVQDGFAQAHRTKNATVGEITKHVKIKVMGMQFRREVTYLGKVYNNLVKENRKPFVFIIAGKKVESKPGIVSKIDVVHGLIERMRNRDKIIIGGAIAYPFIIAKIYEEKIKNIPEASVRNVITEEDMRNIVGDSYIDKDYVYGQISLACHMLQKSSENGVHIKLPVDHTVIVDSKIEYAEKMKRGMMGGDIGPKTVAEWKKDITDADTVVLAGPVGWYENPLFSTGSREITRFIAESKASGTTTIAAGGDTAAMVQRFGYKNDFSLISIGGGATLEFLMHGGLPVMDLLDTKEKLASLEVDKVRGLW